MVTAYLSTLKRKQERSKRFAEAREDVSPGNTDKRTYDARVLA